MSAEFHRSDLDNLNTEDLVNFSYKKIGLQKNKDSLTFLTSFLFLVEETLSQLLVKVVSSRFQNENTGHVIMDSAVRELTFIGKINLFEKTFNQKSDTSFISFLRQMNSLRNQLFHTRFTALKYKGGNLERASTQRDMVFDFYQLMKKSSRVSKP